MDTITEAVVGKFVKGILGDPLVTKEQFEEKIPPKDRENLDLIVRTLKREADGKNLHAEVLVVGSSLRKKFFNDIDLKFSVERKYPAGPVQQLIESTVKVLEERNGFEVERTTERSSLVESGIVETIKLYPQNGGTPAELIPPYGEDDVPLDIEKSARGRNNKYYPLVRL